VSVVLGYGALLDPGHVAELCGAEHVLGTTQGRLSGFRRHWNLVYRNGCWDEGRYEVAVTGEIFEGGVAFLGVEEAPGESLLVREIAVDAEGLAAIDDEEYLYRRVDVRDRYARTDGSRVPPGPVWLYVDVPDEFPEGRYEGDRVVVAREYLDRVRAAAADPLPPPPWPVVDLIYSTKK
jgi:hypothetical protein